MEKKLNINSIIKSKYADDSRKATIVLEKAKDLIDEGCSRLVIDFLNLELVNSVFLQDSIGRIILLDQVISKSVSVRIINFEEACEYLLRNCIELALRRNKR